MKKIIIIILTGLLILSCSMDSEKDNPENIVIFENAYTGIDLSYENHETSTSIYLQNASTEIIIEINYTIDYVSNDTVNDKELTEIGAIVPNESIRLYRSIQDNATITCRIDSITFYNE